MCVGGEEYPAYICTVFTRLQAPFELTPTSSRGLDMKEKSAIKRLSRIEAWSTKTLKIEAWSTKFKVHTCTNYQ